MDSEFTIFPGQEKVTEKQPEDISQTASNLFLSTFMGAQRTEAPVISSTLSRMVVVTMSSNDIPEETRGKLEVILVCGMLWCTYILCDGATSAPDHDCFIFAGSIRIKSRGSSNRGLGSSSHRFRSNPLKNQDRESMEEKEEEVITSQSQATSSSSRPMSGKEMKI